MNIIYKEREVREWSGSKKDNNRYKNDKEKEPRSRFFIYNVLNT